MKKYTAFFTALILIFTCLLTGCAAQPQQEIAFSDPVPSAPGDFPDNFEGDRGGFAPGDFPDNFGGDRGGFAPGDFGGQPPMDPGYAMGEAAPDAADITSPTVETDDLFSNRDLNCEPDLSDAVTVSAKSGSEYTVSSAGTYILTGEAENFTVTVEADKADKVQLVLNGLAVTNDSFPVIYVKSADKCFVTSLGSNSLAVSGTFTADGDTNTDAVIFSKDDLTFNGTGTLTVLSAAGNGIAAKDDLKFTGGSYNITAARDAVEANDSISISGGEFTVTSNKDAFHCENDEAQGEIYIAGGTFTINAGDDGIQATTTLVIDGGEFTITAVEGLEATYVQINGGIIRIQASDDGINAARKCDTLDVVIEINGGEITVVMGPGDTDGLDANGTIIVNGGLIDVTGQSSFDADYGSIYNGGTIIINGTQVDSIPVSMMGGHGGGMHRR